MSQPTGPDLEKEHIELRAKNIQQEMVRALTDPESIGLILIFQRKGQIGTLIRDHVDLPAVVKMLASVSSQ